MNPEDERPTCRECGEELSPYDTLFCKYCAYDTDYDLSEPEDDWLDNDSWLDTDPIEED
jgi:predicted amidophosphoribosyltransferase